MTTEPAASSRALPVALRPWSLTSRLIRFYTVATVALLLLAAWFLDAGLQRSLEAQDRRLLASKAQVLRVLLGEHHDQPGLLAGEVEHEAAESQSLKYYIRVLDAEGRVLIETTGMRQLLPADVFSSPASVRARLEDRGLPARIGGRPFLLLAAEAVEMGPIAKKRVLQIGLDVAHNEELVTGYRRQLLLMLGLGVILSALVGFVVARAGMHPLIKITAIIQRITASKLDERVAAARWPVELAALAAAFDGMLDRLQASFARLSECSSDMAHALRNPINNLRGETEVALAQVRTPQEYQQVLASVMEETERLARMIDSLLFIARADNPNTALNLQQIEAGPEIEAVREFYDALSAEKNVTVTCQGSASFVGDAMFVRRGISNLLANALKHTPAGGRVVITASQTSGGGAEITVADNGAGIPREHLPHIFDRFYQVDQSRGLTAMGAGLGLAIVSAIMRLHRGTVTVESPGGQGSTFRLNFPVLPLEARDRSPRAASPV